MKTRIITALVGLPVLIYVLLWAPLWLFGVVMGVICAIAAYEMLHMSLGKTPRRLYVSVMLSALLMPVIFALGLEFSWGVGILLFLFENPPRKMPHQASCHDCCCVDQRSRSCHFPCLFS